jgi:hypothetical protein
LAPKTFNLSHRGPIGMPMMLVGGEQTPESRLEAMAADLRDWGATNVVTATVPKAGRAIPDQQPEALAALIEIQAGGRQPLSLAAFTPGPGHEAGLAAGQDMQRLFEIPGAGFFGFQPREVAEDLLLAAGRQP